MSRILVLSTLHMVQDIRVLMEGKLNLWWGEGGPHRCVQDFNVLYLCGAHVAQSIEGA